MARIRSIKPEFNISEAIAELSHATQLHFIKLWTYCDDHGRGLDNPRLVKAAIWPLDEGVTPADVEGWHDELEKRGRIIRYSWNGKGLFQVVNWSEHQKPQHPAASKYPSCDSQEVIRNSHEDLVRPTEDEVLVVVDVDVDVEGEKLAPKARERNLLFDAVAEACQINPTELTQSYRGAFGKAVKDLKAVGATPEEILRRAHNWESLFPQATLTPPALAKHWAQLGQARAPNRPKDRFVDMATSLNQRLGGEDEQARSFAGETRSSLPRG